MTCDLEPVGVDGQPAWWVGYTPDPWGFPDWRFAGVQGRFDGRWDDPEGQYRVLYSAASGFGAFVEVLANFRPDPEVMAGLAELDVEVGVAGEGVPVGRVPTSWLRGRALGEARLVGDHADVGHSRSLTYLRRELTAIVVRHRLDDLDASAIRLRAPRAFTQNVSRFIYECTRGDNRPQFHGVVYLSRHGDDLVNYAAFELPDGRRPVEPISTGGIKSDDEDLNRAMTHLGLEWHDDTERD